MREKVIFKQQTVTQDPTGGNTVVWTTFYEPKAVEVREIRPSTDVIAQQSNVQMVVEVKMRYNPEVNIQHGDYIEWRGFQFTNLAFKVDRVERWIWITAFSEIEETSREATV